MTSNRRQSQPPPTAAGSPMAAPPSPQAPEPEAGHPVPRAPVMTEKERAQQRLRERAEEIASAHWIVLICPAGHETQRHRSAMDPNQMSARCVVCGQMAQRESPARTAMREHQAATSPLAVAQNIADRILDWAVAHLESSTWTQQSEARRQELLQRDPTRGDGRNPFSM